MASLFLSFPYCRDETGHSSLRCCATAVIVSISPCCCHFRPTFVHPLLYLGLHSGSLFTGCGHLRFLQPICFFVSVLFNNLSCFILTMCPAHVTLLLTSCQLCKPQFHLFPKICIMLLLSIIFTPTIVLIQLLSHRCSLRCCCSGRSTVCIYSNPLAILTAKVFVYIVDCAY